MILEDLSRPEIDGLREELIALCAQAFAGEPWLEPPARAVKVVDRFYESLDLPGFRLTVARLDDGLAGFAYGYVDSFCAGLDPGRSFKESFELVELAVAPRYQGRGLGRKLHDALLAQAPSPRMLLTHQALDLRSLYARWGWRDLGDVVIPGSESTLALMASTA
jgi:GNAT superfamily N-acetyltransferase